MNLFCKMIIECNPQMMDLITLAPQCVIGVGKNSIIMGVGKDLVHDAWVSVISFHTMTYRIPFRISIFFIGTLMRNVV